MLPILLAVALTMGCGRTAMTTDNAGDNISVASEASIEASEASDINETSEENKDDAASEKTSESAAESTSDAASTKGTSTAASEASSILIIEKASEAATVAASEAATTATQEKATTESTVQPEATQEVVMADSAPKPLDYGRIIFTGDSRTVDMFYGDRNEIWGESFDGIPVFCRDACQSDYMMNAVNSYGWDNFDTLVTWMGCNDYGNFGPYESFYNSLLQQGKNIVVCTVGPTDNNTLANDFDREYYTNERQIAYNNSLVSWANSNGVKVIDLYSYVAGNGNLYISPEDGIHYMPQPTTEIWYYILSNIR